MKIYYGAGTTWGECYDAAVKPRQDTEKIWSRNFNPFLMYQFNANASDIEGVKHAQQINKGDILLLQWPTYSSTEYEDALINEVIERGGRIVALVHDVDFIRFGSGQEKIIQVLNKIHNLILPNEKMHSILKMNGLQKECKVVYQKCWDFLTDEHLEYKTNKESKVVYAGSLTDTKIEFMKSLQSPLEVIGDSSEDICFLSPHITFLGKMNQENLIKHINGNIGLIWSSGNYANYELYNNPYKAAMYIAANVPIICKSDSAISNFIVKNNLGVAIPTIDLLDYAKNKILENPQKYSQPSIVDNIRNGRMMTDCTNKVLAMMEGLIWAIENLIKKQ